MFAARESIKNEIRLGGDKRQRGLNASGKGISLTERGGRKIEKVGPGGDLGEGTTALCISVISLHVYVSRGARSSAASCHFIFASSGFSRRATTELPDTATHTRQEGLRRDVKNVADPLGSA